MLSGAEPLPPRLLPPPYLRPRSDLAPIPDAALTLAADRRRKRRLADDHRRALVGHAENLGDLDQTDGLRRHGGSKLGSKRGWGSPAAALGDPLHGGRGTDCRGRPGGAAHRPVINPHRDSPTPISQRLVVDDHGQGCHAQAVVERSSGRMEVVPAGPQRDHLDVVASQVVEDVRAQGGGDMVTSMG
jgi:hypothetical protein